jgi:general stress protein 26
MFGGGRATQKQVPRSRSRKSLEVRRAHKVGLVFQNDSDEAFASFSGTATLIDESARVTQLWKAAYDAYFPTDVERAAAAFIEVRVEGMRLWIRGVTPEPFGLQPTVLERTTKGQWYLKPIS